MNSSDVKQALIRLAQDNQCVSHCRLSQLQGCKLALPSDFMLKMCLRDLLTQKCDSISSFLEKFSHKTASLGIRFMIVFPGVNDPWSPNFSVSSALSNSSQHRLPPEHAPNRPDAPSTDSVSQQFSRFYKLKSVYWKFEYMKMFQLRSSNLDPGCEGLSHEQGLKNKQILDQILLKMTQNPFMYELLTANFLPGFMLKLFQRGLDYMQAPQSLVNQMLWLLENGQVDLVADTPLLPLLLKEVLGGSAQTLQHSQVILDLDLDQELFTFLDLELLAKKFNLALSVFCRRLKGAFFASIFRNLWQDCFLEKFISCELIKFPDLLRQKHAEDARRLEALLTAPDAQPKSAHWARLVESICQSRQASPFSVEQVKDLVHNSFVMTPDIKFAEFPENKSISGNPLKMNISQSSSIKVLFCLGFVSKELFWLMLPCTGYQLEVPPCLSESFWSYHLIETELKVSLEYSLSRLFSLAGQSPPKCSIRTAYHVRVLQLSVPRLKKIAMPLFLSDSYDSFDLMQTLHHFQEIALKKQKLEYLSFDYPYTESEITKSVFINLLHELGFIAKQSMELGVFAQALLEVKVSGFVQQIILFFEALRLDILDQVTFPPPVSLPSFARVHPLQIFQEAPNPHQPGSAFVLKPEAPEGPESQGQWSVPARDRERLSSQLQLYNQESLNTAETRTFYTEMDFYIRSGERERNFVMMQKNNLSARKLLQINVIARVFILSLGDFVDLSAPDISCMQFVECLRLVQRGLRLRLEADLLYIFLRSKTRQNLEIYQNVFKKLPFALQFSSSAGSLIKTLLVQFCIYSQFKKSARVYSQKLRQRLDVDFIEGHFKLGFSFRDSLKLCADLFEQILTVYEKVRSSFESTSFGCSNVLRPAFDLFKEFFNFVSKG